MSRVVDKVKETNVYQSIIIVASDDVYIFYFVRKRRCSQLDHFVILLFDAWS